MQFKIMPTEDVMGSLENRAGFGTRKQTTEASQLQTGELTN